LTIGLRPHGGGQRVYEIAKRFYVFTNGLARRRYIPLR